MTRVMGNLYTFWGCNSCQKCFASLLKGKNLLPFGSPFHVEETLFRTGLVYKEQTGSHSCLPCDMRCHRTTYSSPELRFASKNLNINFFYVLNPDLKVTHVSLNATANKFRPVVNIRACNNYFHPEVQEI